MKILHCNTLDAVGGAARAAMRLHHALLNQDIDSSMGVVRRTVNDLSVVSLCGRWRRFLDMPLRRAEQLPLSFFGERPSSALFSLALMPSAIAARINGFCADIVHLHWIAYGFIPLRALARITAPVVWTLHDTWAMGGGCHIFQGCAQYENSCAACPQVAPQSRLFVRKSFALKRKAYTQLRPTIVAPSLVMREKVYKSSLLAPFECRYIPNAIDENVFWPVDKAMARHVLGIPQEDAVVAFGAIDATSDKNKGYDLLLDALRQLPELYAKRVRLLVFGASQVQELPSLYPVTSLGQLHDDVSLRLAYSAADVFVCPSREESFSLTTLESLACGTPVAAFEVGGIPEMIEHGVNGGLATPHDPAALARCINLVLSQGGDAYMERASRRVVTERYTQSVIAKQYISLYQELLSR